MTDSIRIHPETVRRVHELAEQDIHDAEIADRLDISPKLVSAALALPDPRPKPPPPPEPICARCNVRIGAGCACDRPADGLPPAEAVERLSAARTDTPRMSAAEKAEQARLRKLSDDAALRQRLAKRRASPEYQAAIADVTERAHADLAAGRTPQQYRQDFARARAGA